MPGDADVRENLDFASLMVVDRIETPEDPFPVRIVTDAVHFLTIAQESWISLILFFFANLAFSVSILARRPALGHWAFVTSVTLGFIVLLLVCSLAWKIYEENYRREGVVVEQRVDILSGPSSDYITVVTVHEGIKVRIRGETEDWYQIILPNGWSGWLPKDSMLPL
jgi:hypothetical protein